MARSPFIGCMTSQLSEAEMGMLEEAVKENALSRLENLLQTLPVTTEDLNRKHLVHQAAWLGYPRCVKLLLSHGASPDLVHKKNGCTAIHLAHLCQVEDTNPGPTIQSLVQAGASVNNTGSHKCSKYAIDHAIQHQRLDSVQSLIDVGAKVCMLYIHTAFASLAFMSVADPRGGCREVTLSSILIAIDVANPQILDTLLLSGGDCGQLLETVGYWSQPLHRVMYTPLKCPKECYKQMFQMLVQATVCKSLRKPRKSSQNIPLMVETELRNLSKHSTELTLYLYTFLIRNGFIPTESIKSFICTLGDSTDWVTSYLQGTLRLRELCVRALRSHLYQSGNISYGVLLLNPPARIRNLIMMYNPY